MEEIDRYNKLVSLGQLYDILADIIADSDMVINKDNIDRVALYLSGEANIISDSEFEELEKEKFKLELFLQHYGDYGR